MRTLFRLCSALLLFAALAPAQRSLGYWFIAPGGASTGGKTQSRLHMGGGGQIGIWKGIAGAIEVGAIGWPKEYTDSVFGLASANAVYHFRPAKNVALDPFVTGGYSLAFRRGTANLGNYGGGLNWWFSPAYALRVEVRDHVYTGGPRALHYWGVRFGMSFTELWP